MHFGTQIFLRIWDLGGSRWVQNTPIGCGNILPTSRNIFGKNVFFEISYTYTYIGSELVFWVSGLVF